MSVHESPIDISRRPLVWLNIVCLDAPLVAISWQWIFARSFHIDLGPSARGALFLTAWLIYLIDRLADSHSLRASSEKSVRQNFCLRHTRVWIGLIPLVAVLDAAIIFTQFDRHLIFWGAFLSGAALIYLGLNYVLNRLWELIPVKEMIIGLLFALGTLLVFVPGFSSATSTLVLAAFLFAALCALNCMSIAAWERDLDRNQGKHSIATRWPSVGVCVRGFCILLAAGSLVLGAADHDLFPLAMCLATSGLFLALLHSMSIQRDERTALADLVLLTPVALLVIGMFW